jgi:hypothetical protein
VRAGLHNNRAKGRKLGTAGVRLPAEIRALLAQSFSIAAVTNNLGYQRRPSVVALAWLDGNVPGRPTSSPPSRVLPPDPHDIQSTPEFARTQQIIGKYNRLIIRGAHQLIRKGELNSQKRIALFSQ